MRHCTVECPCRPAAVRNSGFDGEQVQVAVRSHLATGGGTEQNDSIWAAIGLWLQFSWKWIAGYFGALTVTRFHELLGVILTAVMILVGVLNVIKVYRELRRK